MRVMILRSKADKRVGHVSGKLWPTTAGHRHDPPLLAKDVCLDNGPKKYPRPRLLKRIVGKTVQSLREFLFSNISGACVSCCEGWAQRVSHLGLDEKQIFSKASHGHGRLRPAKAGHTCAWPAMAGHAHGRLSLAKASHAWPWPAMADHGREMPGLRGELSWHRAMVTRWDSPRPASAPPVRNQWWGRPPLQCVR